MICQTWKQVVEESSISQILGHKKEVFRVRERAKKACESASYNKLISFLYGFPHSSRTIEAPSNWPIFSNAFYGRSKLAEGSRSYVWWEIRAWIYHSPRCKSNCSRMLRVRISSRLSMHNQIIFPRKLMKKPSSVSCAQTGVVEFVVFDLGIHHASDFRRMALSPFSKNHKCLLPCIVHCAELQKSIEILRFPSRSGNEENRQKLRSSVVFEVKHTIIPESGKHKICFRVRAIRLLPLTEYAPPKLKP